MRTPEAPRDGLIVLALRKVGQVFCPHEYLPMRFRGRMFLQCVSCGRETVGFVVKEPEPEPEQNQARSGA